jgi:hypothetical protein
MATGVLDLLYVLVFHSSQLAAIAQAGFFNAVELDPAQFDRETAFLHVAFGTTVLILGGLIHWAQPRTGTLPTFLGWALLAFGLFGTILMPVSGFWAVLPQAAPPRASTRPAARPWQPGIQGKQSDGWVADEKRRVV